jgi:Asp/Glu/hydantoin racemase
MSQLACECENAVKEDNVQIIILGGAGLEPTMCSLLREDARFQDHPVKIIDSVHAGVVVARPWSRI